MTYLEVLYKITRTKPDEEPVQNYDYWSIDDNGDILYLKERNPNEIVTHYRNEIFNFRASYYVDYICDLICPDAEDMLDFNKLKKYLEIEVEFETKPRYDYICKYPLMCVRGACDKNCTVDELDSYCFNNIPCTNKRPDWNCWSCKHPDFYTVLHSIFEWISVCKSVNALVVLFDFTPRENEPDLDFRYATGFIVQGNKITIIKDVENAYNDFNNKYPTEDREIESSISNLDSGWVFRF